MDHLLMLSQVLQKKKRKCLSCDTFHCVSSEKLFLHIHITYELWTKRTSNAYKLKPGSGLHLGAVCVPVWSGKHVGSAAAANSSPLPGPASKACVHVDVCQVFSTAGSYRPPRPETSLEEISWITHSYKQDAAIALGKGWAG